MKKLHPTTNIFTPEQRATIKIQSLPETANPKPDPDAT